MAGEARMDGKVCVVTGASSGIGFATARALARMGATMALLCRDRHRADEAAASVRSESIGGTVEVFLADLSSQAEIRRVAHAILEAHPEIHVLVNNAGVVNLSHSTTIDGIERVFAVNHLAYFLLTNLLLERLQRSGHARIVNVASEAHRFSPIEFDDLGHERRYRSMRVYGQSKLANILFTYELARRTAGSGVTVNCLHPGAVGTRLGQQNGWFAVVLTRMLRPFFRTPEQGATTAIYLASSPEVEGVTSKYFINCRERRSSRDSYDKEVARRLWNVSAQMTGLVA